MAFEQFNMGAATAVAVLILVISALLSLISLRISKKYVFTKGKRVNKAYKIEKLTLFFILLGIALFMVFPMVWMILSSLKTTDEVLGNTMTFYRVTPNGQTFQAHWKWRRSCAIYGTAFSPQQGLLSCNCFYRVYLLMH